MKWLTILGGLVFASVCQAQIVVASLGSSDLYQTPFGAGAQIYTRDTTSQVGVGYTEGSIRYSLGTKFLYRGNEVSLGDSQLTGASFGFALRGVTVTRKNLAKHQTFSIFVGAAGSATSVGFYQGFTAQHFGAGMYFGRSFMNDSVHVSSSETIQGNFKTAEEFANIMKRRFTLSGSAGLLQNVRNVNGSASLAIIPHHLNLFGGHSNLLFWTPTTNGEGVSEHATVNNAGASANFGIISLHGGIFSSVAGSVSQGGTDAGGGLHIDKLTATADYFIPRTGQTLFNTSATFRVNRHWSVANFISVSNGQKSINWGGAYIGNELTASVSYQTYYYPFAVTGRSPFAQTLSLSVSFHAPHSSTVNLSTVALPNGKLMYAAGGNSWFEGPMASGLAMEPARHETTGKNEYSGRVVDEKGQPVEGAAVFVGKEETFSDPDGGFILMSKSSKALSLRIELRDFTTPTDYEIISVPQTISNQVPILIVVRRKITP